MELLADVLLLSVFIKIHLCEDYSGDSLRTRLRALSIQHWKISTAWRAKGQEDVR